jgi:hypothetical protein
MAGKLQNGVDAPPAAGNALAVNNLSGGALTSGDTRRPIVVVLGMHRSGTSLCSHILSMLGVDMADELHANSSNEKGHWERLEIMALQDEILTALDRGYWTPQHDFPLPGAWWAEPNVRAVQARIESLLTKKMKENHLFGFKDPRTARLLPLWLQIFRNLNLSPRFVLCLRAPSQVARSLQKRDGLDPAMGEYRALNYLVDCFRYLPHHDICIVDYEAWFENYSDNLHGLMNFLDIGWDPSEADLGIAVSAIVDRDLRHTEERLGVARQPLVRSFHNLAAALRKDPSRRGEIDRFVDQFVAFQQLLAPFERGQRELSGVAARVPILEARIAELEADARAGADREQALAAGALTLEARIAELEAAAHAGAEREQALAANANETGARLAALKQIHQIAEAKWRERELGEAAASAHKAEVAKAERATIVADLTAAEAGLVELQASLRSQSADADKRQRALAEQLAERGGELESLQAAFLELQRQERALRERAYQAGETNTRMGRELETARERLAEGDTRSTHLETILSAERVAAQKREGALNEAIVARSAEIDAARAALLDANWRERALRTSNETAQMTFEARLRTLRDQFVDAEAALASCNARKTRSRLTTGSRRLERKLLRSGLLDAGWYTSEYRDVAQSGLTPARHYLEGGYLKGYRPNPFFDTRWYLDRYDDVRRSGVNPLLHYIEHGVHEGRDPGADFHTEFYLSANPDVRGTGANPLAHYLRHGRQEGRLRTRPT